MAHKTFISYKYNESRNLRNRIIEALGPDATYYQGENGLSPDLTGEKAERIKEYLKGMLFDTTVTILIISPNMRESEWIDWEIEYSLCNYTRSGICSRTNGVVGVIMKRNGGYDWFRTRRRGIDGCSYNTYDLSVLPNIVQNNRDNRTPKVYMCESCKTIDALTGSYISFVTEDEFINNPSHYIENAFDKSEHLSDYTVCKRR